MPLNDEATSDWIDVSVPLKTGMVNWPGDPEVRLERVMTIEAGDDANVTHISMGAHTLSLIHI